MPRQTSPGALAGATGGGIIVAGQQRGPNSTSLSAAPITPDWSPQQLDAIAAITAWLDKGDQPSFYLAGYAGTGKTTLLRSLAQSAGELVLYAAYTGKAASVMRRKGCADATTVD